MFFYISDIHVEQKINFDALPDVMPEEDFGKIIASIADIVFASVMEHEEEDYLLIAGDTCESTHVGKFFFGRLAKIWKPDHIIVILGNHELWTADREWTDTEGKLENNLDAIIEAWRALFDDLGIVFLQNGTYEISEENIVVLGGLGFTGRSKDFNACNGQYLNVLRTQPQDLAQSMIFDRLYEKTAKRCESENKKLVVVTHTPCSSWHDGEIEDEPVSVPVTYISGHTHRNTSWKIENDAGKKQFLADAQVGYHGQVFYHLGIV